MPKLLIQTGNKYLLPPHSPHLHDDVVRWVSELEFCKVELMFFRKLLKQNMIVTRSKKKLSAYYALALKLKKFHEVSLKKVANEVLSHEHALSDIEKNKLIINEKSLNKAHQKLRLSVEAFMGSIRKLKKELFIYIEKQHKENNQ